jgi:ribosomal protein S18 acetylase RimI-like enzyme
MWESSARSSRPDTEFASPEQTRSRGSTELGRIDESLDPSFPQDAAAERRCATLRAAGFEQVPSFNPYWDVSGRTFHDPDGYRIVLQRGSCDGVPARPEGRSEKRMWRLACESDDASVVEMCLGLHREDSGASVVDEGQMRRTLATLRREPWRGRVVVLDVGQQVVGYALLVSYWSNELGGEVCAVDELYVNPDFRDRGHGASLFEELERGDLWPGPVAALALGTTPGDTRARRLYERLGFVSIGVSMVKRSARPPRRLE